MNNQHLVHHKCLMQCQRLQQLQAQYPKGGINHPRLPQQLTADKYDAIGKWCSDVNQHQTQKHKTDGTRLFRKFRYSESMFPPNKSSTGRDSAGVSIPTRLWSISEKLQGPVESAVLTGKVQVRPQSTDTLARTVHSEHRERNKERGHLTKRDAEITVLAVKMSETSDFYTEQRRTVHLQIQPKWQRKLSTGWTINRPLLYSKNTLPDSQFNWLTENIQKDPLPNSPLENKKCELQTNIRTNPSICDNTANVDERNRLNKIEQSQKDNLADQSLQEMNTIYSGTEDRLVTKEAISVNFVHDIENRNIQCQSADKTQAVLNCVSNEAVTSKNGIDKTTLESPPSRFRSIICIRSISNSILNVVSIDDCKIYSRYCSQPVIDHDIMKDQPSERVLQSNASVQQPTRTKEDKNSQETEIKLGSPMVDLEEGLLRTNLSLEQMQLQATDIKNVHSNYSKLTRPSSATVEKAFNVLLDKDFQACPTKQRPFSSPSRLTSTITIPQRNTNKDYSSSARFQRLNAALRKKMYHMQDANLLQRRANLSKVYIYTIASGVK